MEKEVLRLKVPMTNLMLMKMFDGTQHFLNEHYRIFLTESLPLYDLFKQLASSCQLHNDVNVPSIDVAFMKLYDVWVVNLLENLKFFLQ